METNCIQKLIFFYIKTQFFRYYWLFGGGICLVVIMFCLFPLWPRVIRWGACAGSILKDLLRYPLGREGVHATGGPAFLAHTKQKVINIVGLTTLRLAFFAGYV